MLLVFKCGASVIVMWYGGECGDVTAVGISICPVCITTIREPVVYPCGHEICLLCFTRSLETANFCCPLCRKRVSSWARKHAKDPVNRTRKYQIDKMLIHADKDQLSGISCSVFSPSPCKPGDVRKEYLAEAEKFHLELREEERLGELEALRLQQEEEQLTCKLQEECKRGEELARKMQEEEERRVQQLEKQEKQDHDMAMVLSYMLSQQEQVTPSDGQHIKDHRHTRLSGRRKKVVKASLGDETLLPINLWLKGEPNKGTRGCGAGNTPLGSVDHSYLSSSSSACLDPESPLVNDGSATAIGTSLDSLVTSDTAEGSVYHSQQVGLDVHNLSCSNSSLLWSDKEQPNELHPGVCSSMSQELYSKPVTSQVTPSQAQPKGHSKSILDYFTPTCDKH